MVPKPNFTGKIISKRKVEWNDLNKIEPKFTGKKRQENTSNLDFNKKDIFENFKRFLEKIKTSKKPLTYIYRLNRYKFFKEINNNYPYSASFLSKFLKKYPNNIKFGYAPGNLFLAPFLIYQKFQINEKILSELYKRGITIDKIVDNEKASMSILSRFTIVNNSDTFFKSNRFIKYLDNIEKEINQNL